MYPEGLQLHTQRHAYYIYLEHHNINIFQVTLCVPHNQSKLNPCYETLGKRLTLPLQGTLYNGELKTHRQRHAECIYLEHHHINILQVTLHVPQNQLKLIPFYKTLVRTLIVPCGVPCVPRNYNFMSSNMKNIYHLNIAT